MRARLCSIAVALLLSACAAPQIYHRQLQLLDKGMSQAQVFDKLKLAPTTTHRQQINGRTFDLHQYLMNSGVQTSPYLVAFEHDKLIYWGYMDEFRRQPDAALSSAAGAIAQAVLPAGR